MATTQTYKGRALVLRKTKLGERDLIVTMLLESGALARAVAKGARKPGGSFASKLELFADVEFMAAKGRNLDVVTDARFAAGTPRPSFGLEQASCASALAELLACTCQEGLDQPRLFDMAHEAFRVIAASNQQTALGVTAAALVKIMSLMGFRPSLDRCSNCGDAIDLSDGAARVLFGAESGGAVCQSCAKLEEGTLVEASTLAWCSALLASRFAEIETLGIGTSRSFAVLALMDQWIAVHAGKRLKSLTFLFTSGFF